jgi:DNA-binding MarR family transcriptional regulator
VTAEPEDRELAESLSGLHRELGAIYSSVSKTMDLTVQQAQLLCLVANHAPSFGELAALLGCDKTNVTGLVDRLARRDLLRREPDPADRRVAHVVLTEAGELIGKQLRAAFAEVVSERFGAWPAEQRRQLTELGNAAATELLR